MADDLTGGGMNPMTWFLNLFAAMDPAKAGPMLDSLGVPPPSKLGGPTQEPDLASLLNPTEPTAPVAPLDMATQPSPTGMAQPMPMPGIDPASWGANVSVSGPPAAAAAPAANPLAKLAAFQGMKAPEAVKPIMSGGVTGGVKPPEVQVGGAAKAGAPAIQALMAALLGGGGNPLRVPALGDFLRGGKY